MVFFPSYFPLKFSETWFLMRENKKLSKTERKRERKLQRSWQIRLLKQSSSSFFGTLSTDGVIERMVATTKKLLSFLKALIDCNNYKLLSFLKALIDCNNKRLLSFLKALIATKTSFLSSYVRLMQSRIFVQKKETFYDCLFVSCTKRIVEIGDRSV